LTVCSDFALLASADICGACRLSEEAGWNQTGEDWNVFIEHGSTLGIRRADMLVATAAALPYGSGFGFVSMVLVTRAHRHLGLATQLVGACVNRLCAHGLTPVLDATEAGRPVYQKLGFTDVFMLDRWKGMASGTAAPSALPTVDEIAPIDEAGFGGERRFLLRSFLSRAGSQAIRVKDGFALARRGRYAMHIGPVIADSATQAIMLIQALLDRFIGPVFIDVQSRWTSLAAFLQQRGFRSQRSFMRMALDRVKPFGDPSRLFAVAGPEFG
jgi:GNAT superfamily N-acetyltransferase